MINKNESEEKCPHCADTFFCEMLFYNKRVRKEDKFHSHNNFAEIPEFVIYTMGNGYFLTVEEKRKKCEKSCGKVKLY